MSDTDDEKYVLGRDATTTGGVSGGDGGRGISSGRMLMRSRKKKILDEARS